MCARRCRPHLSLAACSTGMMTRFVKCMTSQFLRRPHVLCKMEVAFSTAQGRGCFRSWTAHRGHNTMQRELGHVVRLHSSRVQRQALAHASVQGPQLLTLACICRTLLAYDCRTGSSNTPTPGMSSRCCRTAAGQ